MEQINLKMMAPRFLTKWELIWYHYELRSRWSDAKSYKGWYRPQHKR